MIKPTVGRIVWIMAEKQDQPLAAIITYVHSDTDINVCAFSDTGSTQAMHHVNLVYDEDDSDTEIVKPYATWMPYQKSVAESADKETKSGTLASVQADPAPSPFSAAHEKVVEEDEE